METFLRNHLKVTWCFRFQVWGVLFPHLPKVGCFHQRIQLCALSQWDGKSSRFVVWGREWVCAVGPSVDMLYIICFSVCIYYISRAVGIVFFFVRACPNTSIFVVPNNNSIPWHVLMIPSLSLQPNLKLPFCIDDSWVFNPRGSEDGKAENREVDWPWK